MCAHPLAGEPAPRSLLVNVPRLIASYFQEQPDPSQPGHLVSFGTSGHRGSSLACSFNENHILAITQAICDYRAKQGYTGPLFLGMDTHALSEPAHATALEVLAANGVQVYVHARGEFTPTPVISHAVISHNRNRSEGLADGIVITPSHNPPQDGGFKYNPPHGGPASSEVTGAIEQRANELLKSGLKGVKRVTLEAARRAGTTQEHDYISPYVRDLANVVDMDVIAHAGVRLGVDPLGGSGVHFWEPIAERYGLNLSLANDIVDPTFSFMTVDRDGKIRMDCSSPYAMAGLIGHKDRYELAFGNDPDYDRHGIVTPSHGLMNPNHFLAVAISYLFKHRPGWTAGTAVGKTLVSSSMIDRVASSVQRHVREVPVGFKWFVDGLLSGEFGFAGEESAGASFLRKDGSVWTTDKDGIILDLLAAEMLSVEQLDPGQMYEQLEALFGSPVYERIDAPATVEQKAVLKNLSPDAIHQTQLAGEPIEGVATKASGNQAAIGGLKVTTKNGWFAARPSGTEQVYKIYAESFLGEGHLKQLQGEAQQLVAEAFRAAGVA